MTEWSQLKRDVNYKIPYWFKFASINIEYTQIDDFIYA